MSEFSSSYILKLKDDFSKNAKAMAESAKHLSASFKELAESAKALTSATRGLDRAPILRTSMRMSNLGNRYKQAAIHANKFAASQLEVAKANNAVARSGGGGGSLGGGRGGSKTGWYSEVARMFGFGALSNAFYSLAQDIMRLGASVIDVTSGIEQSFVAVRKAYDFKSPAESEAAKQFALKFASNSVMSIDDIMANMAGGLKAGESMASVKALMPIIERGAVAFDLSGKEMADIVYMSKTLYDLNDRGIANLIDVVNQLDKDNQSTARVTMQMLSGKMGGAASAAGLSPLVTAGFAAAMQHVGIKPSTGQNMFSNLVSRLAGKFTGGERGYSLIKSGLGIDMLDYTRTLKKDGMQAAIFKVLDDINRLIKSGKDNGVAASQLVSNLIGEQYAGNLKTLARKFYDFKDGKGVMTQGVKSIVEGVSTSGYGARSAEKEYAEQSNTYQAQLQKFTNQIQTMMYEVGVVLLPILVEGMQDLKPHIEAMTDWLKNNKPIVKEVVKNLVKAVPVLIVLSGVFGVLAVAAQIAAADLVGAKVSLGKIIPELLLFTTTLQSILNIFDEMQGTDYMESLFSGMKQQMKELGDIYNLTVKPAFDFIEAGITLVLDLTLSAVVTTLAAVRMLATEIINLLPEDMKKPLEAEMNANALQASLGARELTDMSKGVRKHSANMLHYVMTGQFYEDKRIDFVKESKAKLESVQIKKNLEEGGKSSGKAFMQYVDMAGNRFRQMVEASKIEVEVEQRRIESDPTLLGYQKGAKGAKPTPYGMTFLGMNMFGGTKMAWEK